jgi:diaminohydroxyphosphoribosylaminopyrimidine deaminase/5-amino-6-(5-phosphoribosylamino)uracil reductase
VRLKIAATLDGRTALRNGQSRWITGAEARRDGHAWRARACAVLTGIGTVKADDPELTARDVNTPRQPQRIVVDSRIDIPDDARVLGRGTMIAAAVADRERAARLAARGAEVLLVAGDGGRVDLHALLAELGRRGMNEVHVEAGAALNGALLRERLADELVVYLAPAIFGDRARGMFDLPELQDVARRYELALREVHTIGADVRIIAAVKYA